MVQVSGIVLDTNKPQEKFNFLKKQPFNFKAAKGKFYDDQFFIEIRPGKLNSATELHFVADSQEFRAIVERLESGSIGYKLTPTEIIFEGPIFQLTHHISIKPLESINNQQTIIDHLAFVTPNNDTDHQTVTNFYQEIFGLDQEVEPITMKYGQFVLDINLLHSGSSQEQFVVSRSLSTKEDQITKFLSNNGNVNGLQHIAFRCDSSQIFELNSRLSNDTNLKTALPPPGYYDSIKEYFTTERDLSWYNKAKHSKLLIDKDEKLGGYLFQLFSRPVLGEDTLFLEFIYRVDNDHGLGARNVEALWRSLET